MIENLKNKLLQERKEIIDFLNNNDLLNTDDDGDDIDKVQSAYLNKMQNHLNKRKASRLKEIEESLKRIENCQYGECEDCDEKIGLKRLEFNPCIRTCIACAESREIELKKKGIV